MGQVLTVVCVQNTGTCTLHRKATFTFFKKGKNNNFLQSQK